VTALTCTCGRCPAVRLARGLAPFCQMSAPVRQAPAGFATYTQASEARQPSQRIRAVGGLGTGSPTRFVLEEIR
jgi:hypothetical protein